MWTSLRLPRPLRARRIAALAGLGLLALAAGWGGVQVYERVPLLPFVPVCRDYHRAGGEGEVLHDVAGAPSGEFRRDLRLLLRSDQWRGAWFAEREGALYITPRSYFAAIEGKFGGERGGFRYYLSRDIVWDILQRRIAEGAIDERSAAAFYVSTDTYGDRLPEPELMAPSECGFMEALITAGGRFARD